ncbi:GNAT family N-acetyltransferase [Paenibacillus albicereus]|uniref:GNAT family N-acetyltransferase n=1 Tax=Paenibacillus albicereus TaxID=2726185 RepID=A0A6H2GXJ3_9BACL|nr:GNAT family N-acetyltransferase [Paenibacillus albicereus]QJC52151.1 GNAT family N-acetyltransferase [Paenibacillus albicereus]
MDLSLHKIDVADADVSRELRLLQTAAYREEAKQIGFDAIPGMNESHEELLACPAEFYGCRIGDRLAGAVAVEPEADGSATIARLVVHPDFFRRGIGRFLLKEALALHSGKTILVSTGEANAPAVSLYLSSGFKPDGRFEPAPGLWIARFRLAPDVSDR